MMVWGRALGLHVAVLLLLFALHFTLPAYHHGNLARILVLAVYAMGYNVMFGYTGLLSLGHALFFAAGMYGLGLTMQLGEMSAVPAFGIALVAALVVSLVTGLLALRTTGVALMIVTLMFAQADYLTILYFGEYTRGDEGFVISRASRSIAGIDLSDEGNRYLAGLLLFGVVFLGTLRLVSSPFGKVLVAIRENEDRARMLGYDVGRYKLLAFVLSGVISGAAGAAYALLFGYAGASFAAVPYSIFPLLWVLLGGAGTVLGPLIGTVFMFYLVDISSTFTSAYMIVVGIALVLLTLFAREGLMGEVRRRWFPWLP